MKIELSNIQLIGLGILVGGLLSGFTIWYFSILVGIGVLTMEYYNKRKPTKFINFE